MAILQEDLGEGKMKKEQKERGEKKERERERKKEIRKEGERERKRRREEGMGSTATPPESCELRGRRRKAAGCGWIRNAASLCSDTQLDDFWLRLRLWGFSFRA